MDESEHVTLGRIDERVTHIQKSLLRFEAEYVKLARYIAVERAVFGLIAIVAVALVAIAVPKLFGGN